MADPVSSEQLSLPLIDAHHHLWDLENNYYPWLHDDPPIPFRYGDYQKLRDRSFRWSDYESAARSQNVVATVVIEGEWDRATSVAETAWVSELAKQVGHPDAFVAHAELDHDNIAQRLREHAAYPIVRGIRHKPAAGINPGRGASDAPTLMRSAAWRRGFARLAEFGLHFELQVPWQFLDQAVELGRRYPAVPIVLNHAGLPVDRSQSGLAQWGAALERLAELPEVSVKISGLGGADGWWDCEANTVVVHELVRIFGADRCMIGSNYPVDALCVGFDTMMECYRKAIAHLSGEHQRAILCDNAMRVYRIDRSSTERAAIHRDACGN